MKNAAADAGLLPISVDNNLILLTIFPYDWTRRSDHRSPSQRRPIAAGETLAAATTMPPR
jgi:hypothetical protein